MLTIPRVVIAAPASGHGKTSVSTGLLSAYRRAGFTVSAHKVGPDYIDPGYHTLAAGRIGRNLDPWLVGEERIRDLFVHGATVPSPADIAVVEGVMGLFDGAVARPGFASTAHVAKLLQAPIVLVVDCAGMGASVAALVHGFATVDPALTLGGVILNRVSSDRHEQILLDALRDSGVEVFGAIRRRQELATPSRHLGLIPASERRGDATATVAALGETIGDSVDLEALAALARSAPPIQVPQSVAPPAGQAERGPRPVIAVAGGPAFTFGYAEQAELLQAAGAEVVTLDPLRDESLPSDCRGLVLGGGFPEMYAEALSENVALRTEVRQLAATGAPVAAECAGLLYLARTLDGHPMAGVVDVEAHMTDRLTLGYREAVAVTDSWLAAKGTVVRGHEFHRTTCLPGHGSPPAWRWNDVREGFAFGRIHASYLHLHWSGVPGIAGRFVRACGEPMAVSA